MAALGQAVEHDADAQTILVDGRPAGITGAPDDYVWLLGTNQLTAEPRLFLEASRWIWDAVTQGRMVHNIVYAENHAHIKWLRWLGCEFGEPIPGIPFIPFHKVGLCANQ